MALVQARGDRRRGVVAWGHRHTLFVHQWCRRASSGPRDVTQAMWWLGELPPPPLREWSRWHSGVGDTGVDAYHTLGRLLCQKWHYGVSTTTFGNNSATRWLGECPPSGNGRDGIRARKARTWTRIAHRDVHCAKNGITVRRRPLLVITALTVPFRPKARESSCSVSGDRPMWKYIWRSQVP